MKNTPLLCTHLPPARCPPKSSLGIIHSLCWCHVKRALHLFDSPPLPRVVTLEHVPQALLGKCLESEGKPSGRPPHSFEISKDNPPESLPWWQGAKRGLIQ